MSEPHFLQRLIGQIFLHREILRCKTPANKGSSGRVCCSGRRSLSRDPAAGQRVSLRWARYTSIGWQSAQTSQYPVSGPYPHAVRHDHTRSIVNIFASCRNQKGASLPESKR